MPYVSIKKVALKCPIFDTLIYIGQCNATNKQRQCEASDCRPLRSMVNAREDVDKEGNPVYIIPEPKKGKKHGRRIRVSDDCE